MMDSLRQDLGYALRGFRREAGFAIVAMLILALGIGANTAVFSIINPLLLRPLPFPDAEKLVWLAPDPARSAKKRQGMSDLTYTVAVFELLQRESRSFAGLSAYNAFFGYGNNTLTGRGDPERIVGVDVAPRFFELLGVQPAHGRLFTREELTPNGPRALLMSHALWVRRFAADPAIVGKTLSVNHVPVTVAGVLPETFDFSSTFTPGVRVDYFTPLDLDRVRNYGHLLAIIGRVRPNATPRSAHAEMATLMPRLDAAHPSWGNMNVGVTALKDHVSGHMRRSLVVLWSAVGLVMLIVCANLSNLLLARTATRRKEIAVRMALGAGRARIVRQLLTEGIALSLVGAALGVPLAYVLTAAVRANVTLSVPLLHQVHVDGAALLFTAAVAITAGSIVGILPGLRLAGRDPHAALKEQSRGSTDGRGAAWLRSTLVIAEVTLACVLLVGTGLLLRSFVRLLEVDLGFEPARVFALRVDAGLRRDRTDEQRLALLAELVRRVRAIPGVDAAGTTDALPLDRNRQWYIGAPGQKRASGEEPTSPFVYVVGPGYFRAMGIALTSGRDFADEDTATSQPVIVLNETLARLLFQDRDPLGRLLVGGDPKNPYRVVAVVADVRQNSLDEATAPQMYVAETQRSDSPGSADLIVRTTLPPGSIASSVRATVGAVDPFLTSTDLRPIEMLVERSVSPRRLLLTLLLGFALLALLLACLGIYGVVSYGVSQRVQEIGVRMALGATAGDVGRQIIGGTLRLAAISVTLGLLMAYVVARLIASLLFGTSPTDLPTFAGAAAVLTLVAIAAGAVPALRAARLDPMSALRAE